MKLLVNTLPFIGRVLIAALFLFSGISKVFNFAGTQSLVSSVGLSPSAFWVILAIVSELYGSLTLLFGFKGKFASFVLVVYMIVVTFLFHFHLSDRNQLIHFLSNFAVVGGLVNFMALGTGAFSLDNVMKKKD